MAFCTKLHMVLSNLLYFFMIVSRPASNWLISYYLVGIPAGEVTAVHPFMLSLKCLVFKGLLHVYHSIFLFGLHFVD
jgi:hypothetical protein